MSYFSSGQLNQLGDALERAGWLPEDVTNLGQAGKARLAEIRLSLQRNDIITLIETKQTEPWLHDDQKADLIVQGYKILAYLDQNGLLDSCANLGELRSIQFKGIEFFQRYFAGKVIFGWGGVDGESVPCLFVFQGEVVQSRRQLNNRWHIDDPGLRRI
ncbi:hypothetical protein A2917_03345 [Candidatus Nomurabacteria bacterium RIFCSPLOWO2_01_FULL_42_17]|uniref:Uncharacterized protein n=1 Tax=Candidatus Nomurabacteria bacterium RIFCSPLOWO2_01_FULL_42_17 TaxID=1801780 RepID=A0A1F6XN01_9BACT|nr:MAG: hypothetical protein A2917_03345 [Candidatus Nomurabacteria bacterium RIFCSPLOWO2_01_FULL_42_17]